MVETTFEANLLEKLKLKERELSEDISRLCLERDNIREGIKSLCMHHKIKLGSYTFDHDSYSQTYSEGTTYQCEECGLYEKGRSGVLSKSYWGKK